MFDSFSASKLGFIDVVDEECQNPMVKYAVRAVSHIRGSRIRSADPICKYNEVTLLASHVQMPIVIPSVSRNVPR